MNRLDTLFGRLRTEKRKALSIFVTAGYPSAEITVPLVLELERSGADLVEIGVPFSDPIADGPIIQQSSEQALRDGMTLARTLDIVQQIRSSCELPIVLMGYANPIYAYGLAMALDRCRDVGVDGMIIADMPLEESTAYCALARERTISSILLAAPTSSDARLRTLDDHSTGFLYCVSITGITGSREGVREMSLSFLKRARACVTKNPLLIGFGISTPDDAYQISRTSDGVIIGSALTKILGESSPATLLSNAGGFVTAMRGALDRKE